MNTSSDQHVVDLIPGYALGCLNVDESSLVGLHLSMCAECRAAFEAYRQVADDLYLAVPEGVPSSGVKNNVMARIRSIGHRNGSTRGVGAPAGKRMDRKLWPVAPAWGMIGLALVIVLGLSNLFLWQRIQRMQAEAPASFRTVNLAGTENAPAASGILVMDQEGDHGTLVVNGLPALSAENQYQLWVIHDGQRASGGVFSVSDAGYGAVMVEAQQSLFLASSFGVTIEPVGGSPGPTGKKVLGGSPAPSAMQPNR